MKKCKWCGATDELEPHRCSGSGRIQEHRCADNRACRDRMLARVKVMEGNCKRALDWLETQPVGHDIDGTAIRFLIAALSPKEQSNE